MQSATLYKSDFRSELCPDCARQGQKLTNISKQNQKHQQLLPFIQPLRNTGNMTVVKE